MKRNPKKYLNPTKIFSFPWHFSKRRENAGFSNTVNMAINKKNALFWSFPVFLVFGIMGCCDDDLPINMCSNGYEEVDGSCGCPEGKYSAYGFCKELAEDEWYAVLDGCICEDTLFFKIVDTKGGIAKIRVNDGINVDIPDTGWWVGGSFDMDYYQLPDGDSLAHTGLPYGTLFCNGHNFGAAEYREVFYGKFTPLKDTLNMKIVYTDFQFPSIIVDSCFVTFTR